MADKENGFVRWVRLKFDKAAARRMQDEAEDALEKAGKLGGVELTKELEAGGNRAARALSVTFQREYKLRMARARRELADATIDEREFREKGREAAREFNASYSAGLKQLQAKGKLTELQLANASSRLKTISSEAAGGAGLLARAGVGSALAGVFTASAALAAGQDAIAKADELEASIRKLGGAARVTGTDLHFLEQTSAQVQDRFKLSVPFANELTGAMNKMAVRAGDANLLLPALAAWLDLAAANGLGAADAMAALQTTIIGQDEGLNKLGLSNPQQIYEAWGKAAGVSAAKMTDAQKAQAILNAVTEAGSKVQGEYGKYLEGNAGKADQQAQSIDRLKAKTGEALQPVRQLGGVLKEVLYANLLLVANVVGKLVTYAGKTFSFTLEAITKPGEVWDRLWNGGADRGPVLRDASRDYLDATIARINAGTALDAAGNPYKSPSQRRAEATARAAKDKAAKEEREKAQKKAAEKAAEDKKTREEARVKGLFDGLEKYLHSQGAYDSATGISQGSLQGGGIIQSARPGIYTRPADAPLTGKQSAFAAMFGTTKEQFEADAEEAAYNIASAFQDAFDLMRQDGATLGNFFEGIFRGMAGFALAGLSSFAAGKAKENFAAAIEAAAYALGFASHLNFASASAAWASAAEHTAAGVAWGALAGGSGSARGAATGGRGAVPANTRVDPGLSTFEGADKSRPEIHIYIDPLNPKNPAYQRNVYAAQQYARDRFGEDAHVSIHPAVATP